jgi:hypothetical protein
VRSAGYVGSFVAELGALIELAEGSGASPLLRSLLTPRLDLPGDYVRRPLAAAEVPVNISQVTFNTRL